MAERREHGVLAMQRAVGNRVVTAFLQRQDKGGGGGFPKLTIKGVWVAGEAASAIDVIDINEAAKQVKTKRFIAYATYVKLGGTIAWRANNPGNLRGAPTAIGKAPGAVGTFAVFETMDDGRAAQRALYLNSYGTAKVRAAVMKLTPPSENDTETYLKRLAAAGVDLEKPVAGQIDTLMAAIEANEGMVEGVLIARRPRSALPE
ncbi:hypothetical protein [Actinorhabdospora filicis]|uniref:hypothetical protein n=1 Tax=Actinorhabdospora filicis TaxID=1785913 RepID=UPI002556C92F|nr:hypothetical protein [Actinorhabdospora filicis]